MASDGLDWQCFLGITFSFAQLCVMYIVFEKVGSLRNQFNTQQVNFTIFIVSVANYWSILMFLNCQSRNISLMQTCDSLLGYRFTLCSFWEISSIFIKMSFRFSLQKYAYVADNKNFLFIFCFRYLTHCYCMFRPFGHSNHEFTYLFTEIWMMT